MRVLKEVTTPQTIVICDAYNDENYDVMITDDECGFSIRKGNGHIVNVESFGFISIFTKEEFLKYSKTEDALDNGDWNRFVVINDYTGSIGVTGIMEDGSENDDWELDDYFYHQMEDSDLIINVSGDYDFESSSLEDALLKIESKKGSKLTDILSEDTKDEIYSSIENQGFGYWIQNYGYKGDEDVELKELCKKARKAMNKLQERIIALGVEC